jgi:glycosyltransferase involved in cell wall biosynthesis
VLAVAGSAAGSREPPPGPSVRFLGMVDEVDLPALYTGASVFVFPSLLEGFGLPVLEAMACGAPVVCSDTSSLPEVAGDAAVLCDPTDVSALAAAIDRVLADGDLRVTLRQRGLARAAGFTWEETARRFAQLYGDVLARRPRAGEHGSTQ